MKRMHVHVSVADLEQNIRFYSTLFGAEPTVRKPDYAKWMLDDPRLNFAISQRGRQPGLDHLGLQAEDEGELAGLSDRLKAADLPLFAEGKVSCCYAQSDKAWITDPQGIPWETFHTFGAATTYGESGAAEIPASRDAAGCCAPASCCGPAAGQRSESAACCR
jgi:catechol 2,3-dioxygenase-like lactoylglutathione lyase family enzyme